MKLRLKIPDLSLRLKLTLLLSISLISMALVCLYAVGSLWRDLSLTYNFYNHHAEINRGINEFLTIPVEKQKDFVENNFPTSTWFLEVSLNPAPQFRWLKEDSVSQSHREEIEKDVIEKVTQSGIKKASFETVPRYTSRVGDREYWSFQSDGDKSYISISKFQLKYQDIAPWTYPLLFGFSIIFILSIAVALFFASKLSRSYDEINRSLEYISAGNYKQLALPQSKDIGLRNLGDSVRRLAKSLNDKDEALGTLTKSSEEDYKTGLLNFRAFEKILNEIFNRTPSDKNIFLILLDLDHFKKVNDTYGHLTGDAALKKVADFLKNSKLSADLQQFSRFGGEEFLGIVVTSEKEDELLNRILNLGRTIKNEKIAIISNSQQASNISVSTSVGVSLLNKTEHTSVQSWIKETDDAVYQAKKQGRSRIVYSGPQNREIVI